MHIGRAAFLSPPRTMIGLPRGDDVGSWAAAVVANGGTVSDARKAIVNTFIAAEKAAGTWDLTDDYWGLWAENAAQALTSLKQRRLATLVAAPTFTADRDYTFNGTTQHLDTGFIPDAHRAAMNTDNCRIAAYERTNVSATGYAAGVHSSTSRSLRINPRTTTPVVLAAATYAVAQYTLSVVDSRGFTSASRSPGSVPAVYKNGAALVQSVAPASYGASLPSSPVFAGAYNNAGTAASWRTASIGLLCVGAALSAAQEAAQYANVQAWATAVGAQV
jgi:hypothetical protein